MRTFSHVVITVAAGNYAGFGRGPLLAFAAGSALPDVPLLILTGLSMLTSPSWAMGMERMHRAYALSPFWIGAHNAPHSLVVLGAVALLTFLIGRGTWKQYLLWAVVGATGHSVIDIFTHAGDGPMFLYPATGLRFDSPVSYWDPTHFGRTFAVFEYALDAVLALYLLAVYFRRKRLRR